MQQWWWEAGTRSLLSLSPSTWCGVISSTDRRRLLSDGPQHSHSQTCQGPEMKMRETVRHSGEAAIFSRGGALPVMRPLSKFSDSCLHFCCRTEEIKFSIKPITRKPIQSLLLFYKIKYKTLSVRRTYVYDISVANPAYTKWTPVSYTHLTLPTIYSV